MDNISKSGFCNTNLFNKWMIMTTVFQRVKFLLKPSQSWGPAHKVPTFDINEPDDGIISNPNFSSTVIPNFDSRDPKV